MGHTRIFHFPKILANDKKYWILRTIWSLWTKAKSTLDKKVDVHTRLMKQNYETVPNWWFYVILVVVFGVSLFALEGFNGQLQLPWWGLIMACCMAMFFTLPIGIIQATTNQVIIRTNSSDAPTVIP